MRVHDVRDLRATALRVLDQGALISRRSTVEWDVSGNCQNAKLVTLTGRPARKEEAPTWRYGESEFPTTDPRFWATYAPERKQHVVRDEHNNPLWLDFTVRCRKCDKCLAARSRLWTERAIAETRFASRTWMGTLTLSPEQHYVMECRASHRLKSGAVVWSSLNEDDQLGERHREISREITLWLKRVRQASNAKLRFLLVMERHKTGLPHYHCLIHEGAIPVVKRVLSDQWKLGFSKFKLVEQEAGSLQRASYYVAKYLTKAANARVRASVGYGNPLC